MGHLENALFCFEFLTLHQALLKHAVATMVQCHLLCTDEDLSMKQKAVSCCNSSHEECHFQEHCHSESHELNAALGKFV